MSASRTLDAASSGKDSDILEKMTVQELRTKLRMIGVPAKGCKRDLISALKSSINNQADGRKGSSAVDYQIHSKVEPPSGRSATKNSKRASIGELNDNKTMTLEVSANQQSKKRIKRDLAGIVDVEDESVAIATELVLKGKKSSQLKSEASSQISSVEIGTSNKVDPSEHQTEPWTVLTHKKPQKGWVPYNPRTMRLPPRADDINSMKIMSWNVNGIRALLKLEGFSAAQLAQRENFDILCLQETKLQEKDIEVVKEALLEGYENSFWTCSVSKLGYSGTAIISRVEPLSVRYGLGISDHDSEGRLVTAEFDKFYLLNAYVPNSGDGLRRLSYRVTQWDTSLSSYMKELEKSKPVILTGDLNCAHQEIDIFDPAGNKRSAGFTIEERTSFETNYLNNGFVDTFRKQHPGVVGYTYWGYRHGGRKTNKGWRLDYFLVSESISEDVHDSYILPDVNGSDHCPIGLILKQ